MITSPDANILYHKQNAVFTVEIHRPEKKNALTQTMYKAMAHGIEQADADEEVNVILLRGAENCFTSGNDVNDFVNAPAGDGESASVVFMRAISRAKKPVIAAVGGLAIGIGTTMLFHCDLVYAAEDSYLQLPFSRLGLCPEAGSSYLLPQMIGHQRASELLLLGERFSARQAREYGIVNEVLPSAGYLEHATNKAVELAKLPSESVQVSKALIKRQQQPTLDSVITEELEHFSRLVQSAEAQAILKAFLSKKK